MERQLRKRRRVDDQSRSDAAPPRKKTKAKRTKTVKTKTRREAEREAWASWVYPPEFWDRLSELNLTRKAVAELNRRTRLQRHPVPRPVPVSPSISLAQFARHGGPDLTDLRGYPHPVSTQPAAAMSASESAESQATRSIDPASTVPTTVTTKTTKTTKTKKSTPYNRDFDMHLEDHGIYPEYSSREPDMDEVLAAITVPRPSLSPSKFSKSDFKEFQYKNSKVRNEAGVVADVFPTISGSCPAGDEYSRNTVFGNLAPLTDGTLVSAQPDIYHGAHPKELSRPVRDALGKHIVPSTLGHMPLAHNFFVELKGPAGDSSVAALQARYDGAMGSRAMHSLQNYGEEEAQYDGNPYTYSSIYHGGMLELNAHHITAPTKEGGRPEYHMTQVKSYAVKSDIDTFVKGATAFRNTRDLAKRHRDDFIRAANDKALALQNAEASDTLAPQNAEASDTYEDGVYEEDGAYEAVDTYEEDGTYNAYGTYEAQPLETLEENTATGHSQWRNGDEALQQAIADTSGYDYDYDNGGEGCANPQPFYAEADSEEPSQHAAAFGDDPMALPSSLTSTPSSSKRHGPHSSKGSSSKGKKRHRKKHA